MKARGMAGQALKVARYEGFIARLCAHYGLNCEPGSDARFQAAENWLEELMLRAQGLAPRTEPENETEWVDAF
jgi:hypothetical protein